MKTKLIGILAIVIAIGASAFTNPAKATRFASGPYWFLIDDGIAKGNNAVPAADATFIQQSTTAPAETSCVGTTNQCVSGFDASQVNTSTDQLKDDAEISLHQSSTQN